MSAPAISNNAHWGSSTGQPGMHSLRLDLRIMVPIAKLLLMGILIVSSIKVASDASMCKALTLNDRQLPKLYFYSNERKIVGVLNRK